MVGELCHHRLLALNIQVELKRLDFQSDERRPLVYYLVVFLLAAADFLCAAARPRSVLPIVCGSDFVSL